ncbi:hypothetical protein BTVI_50622 [Pitangus sulphuratus]|nr:hypothetical protein BTVI_50622 [Pitangus sulphuratus]
MVKDLEGKPYEERLRSVQPGEEETDVRPLYSHSFLVKERKGSDTDLFSVVTSDETQANGLKLYQGRLRLDIRKRFFTQRVFGHWNRLPREVFTTPSLTLQEVFG